MSLRLIHARELFSRYAAAGWEPVTSAAADNKDVWIERFGSSHYQQAQDTSPAGSVRGLFFTVYNRSSEPRTTVINIETAALGLENPVSSRFSDLETGREICFEVLEDNRINFALDMEPQETRIIKVEDGVPRN